MGELKKQKHFARSAFVFIQADGGVVACNYLSGKHIMGVSEGAPLYYRRSGASMTLANLMRAELCAPMATLMLGIEILFGRESAEADSFTAQGGLFKVEGVARQMLANALRAVALDGVQKSGGDQEIAYPDVLFSLSRSERRRFSFCIRS